MSSGICVQGVVEVVGHDKSGKPSGVKIRGEWFNGPGITDAMKGKAVQLLVDEKNSIMGAVIEKPVAALPQKPVSSFAVLFREAMALVDETQASADAKLDCATRIANTRYMHEMKG